MKIPAFVTTGGVMLALSALSLGAVGVNSAYAAEPVVVLVKVFPTPGREDELQAQYLKRISYLRNAEPGAAFRLHRSTKTPVTFLWYEVYESQAAYDDHLKVVMPAFRKQAGPTPVGLLAKPSEVETYSELSR
ncbi:antibiotic biosynthesis monooxygenase [Cupriavidus necator]|uniref:Antibiotic biosynthesis monooxygenase n=1 Tax=Cupriavidus necator TaxID=106590 RepID=A0A1U9UVH5_CUPNE|nr:antibiotic biosynthesis monooxygenase family protein [Cupriavidus necator]AQV96427.1 antibiotic biosynthesis monooxygenase [Cupriavidus necator]